MPRPNSVRLVLGDQLDERHPWFAKPDDSVLYVLMEVRQETDYVVYDKKSRAGDRSCPFNSLYWDFFARHREKLGKNPRIGMMVRTFNRMKAGDREKILARAEGLKRNLDSL